MKAKKKIIKLCNNYLSRTNNRTSSDTVYSNRSSIIELIKTTILCN